MGHYEEGVKLIQHLNAKGYQAYFVGGFVRDKIMNLNSYDYDITTNCRPEVVQQLFSKTIPTGIDFGTITVCMKDADQVYTFEVTTFRQDAQYEDGRHPSSVEFSDTLIEDLRRRDFTMNALAMLPNGEIFDYFNGFEHIQKKIICSVGDPYLRFSEDYLRMLRAVRFVSKLGFKLSPNVRSSLKKLAHNITKVSIERRLVEIEKLIVGDYAEKGLVETIELGLWQALTKDSGHLVTTKKLDQLPATLVVRLIHLLNKYHFDHAKDILSQLGIPKKYSQATLEILEVLESIKSLNDDLRICLKIILSKLNHGRLDLFISTINTLTSGMVFNERFNNFEVLNHVNQIYKNQEALFIKDLAIDGHTLIALGYSGREIGSTLESVLQMVLTASLTNDKASILKHLEQVSITRRP